MYWTTLRQALLCFVPLTSHIGPHLSLAYHDSRFTAAQPGFLQAVLTEYDMPYDEAVWYATVELQMLSNSSDILIRSAFSGVHATREAHSIIHDGQPHMTLELLELSNDALSSFKELAGNVETWVARTHSSAALISKDPRLAYLTMRSRFMTCFYRALHFKSYTDLELVIPQAKRTLDHRVEEAEIVLQHLDRTKQRISQFLHRVGRGILALEEAKANGSGTSSGFPGSSTDHVHRCLAVASSALNIAWHDLSHVEVALARKRLQLGDAVDAASSDWKGFKSLVGVARRLLYVLDPMRTV